MRTIIITIALCLVSGVALADSRNIPVETIMQEEANNYQGMVAIGEVIRNRAKERGLSFAEVCLQPRQFSCWNSIPKANAWLQKYGTGELYQKASKAWAESESSNITKGATLYANLGLCKPSWAKKAVLVAKVGKHTFYRETGYKRK